MKIERVNENQIRCTLNQADLASRQLKISELAYGSEKAKELFRDMMQQASYEVGFEADDIPLMIEAIPISSDCIVLIITKVENPEELDTRFSKFSPLDDGEYDYDDDYSDIETIDDNSYNDTSVPPTAGDELDADTKTTSEGGIIGDDLMNLFSKVRDYLNNSKENTVSTGSRHTAPDTTAIPEEFANSIRSCIYSLCIAKSIHNKYNFLCWNFFFNKYCNLCISYYGLSFNTIFLLNSYKVVLYYFCHSLLTAKYLFILCNL